MSPTATGLPANQTKAYIGGQIQKVEQELTTTEGKLADAETSLAATKDPLVQRFYQDQITQQHVYASDLRNVLTTLYGLYQATYTNQITVVEAATEPYEVDLNTRLSALLAAFAGAIAALALVFAFVYFDDTIHTPEELEDALGLPLFGVIGKHKPRSRKKRSYNSSVKRNKTYLLGEQQY